MVPAAAKQISMSPDGSHIAVCTDDAVKLVSAETGIEQATVMSGSALVQWDRSAESTSSRLAAVDSSGLVQVIEDGKAREIGRIPAGGSAKGIHFFRESWNDPNKKKATWLLVHSSAGAQDELLYFNEDPNQIDKNRRLALTGKVSAIECSPTEGLFVVGGYGTVAIYFAAPTLGEAGKELFGLQGHAGAEVSLLHFTSDGKTLLTGDSNSRLFGWLSEDVVSNKQLK
jgi:WD40 repeat protein